MTDALYSLKNRPVYQIFYKLFEGGGKVFSSDYPIFGTQKIKIKFQCKECNEFVEDEIYDIPAADLAGGDTHRETLNSDIFTTTCPNCGNEYSFTLGTSCCGGEIDCEDLEQDDVEMEIEVEN